MTNAPVAYDVPAAHAPTMAGQLIDSALAIPSPAPPQPPAAAASTNRDNVPIRIDISASRTNSASGDTAVAGPRARAARRLHSRGFAASCDGGAHHRRNLQVYRRATVGAAMRTARTPAALGFRAHTGWAALPATGGPAASPTVLHRARVERIAGHTPNAPPY
ncbi:MAG: hypothetical protein ACXWJ3_16855, partial [Caldimonas sp.]